MLRGTRDKAKKKAEVEAAAAAARGKTDEEEEEEASSSSRKQQKQRQQLGKEDEDASPPPPPLHVAFVMDVSGDALSEDADPGGGSGRRVSRLAAMTNAVRYLAADAAPSRVAVILCDPSKSNNNNNNNGSSGRGSGVVHSHTAFKPFLLY